MTSPNGPAPLPEIDVALFEANRRRFPPEQLLTYAGKFVAWSADGTRILVSGDSYEEVDDRLDALGIHFSQVVHSYVEPPGLSQLS